MRWCGRTSGSGAAEGLDATHSDPGFLWHRSPPQPIFCKDWRASLPHDLVLLLLPRCACAPCPCSAPYPLCHVSITAPGRVLPYLRYPMLYIPTASVRHTHSPPIPPMSRTATPLTPAISDPCFPIPKQPSETPRFMRIQFHTLAVVEFRTPSSPAPWTLASCVHMPREQHPGRSCAHTSHEMPGLRVGDSELTSCRRRVGAGHVDGRLCDTGMIIGY